MPDAGALTADTTEWYVDSTFWTADMTSIGNLWAQFNPPDGNWVEQDVDAGPWVEQVIPSWGT